MMLYGFGVLPSSFGGGEEGVISSLSRSSLALAFLQGRYALSSLLPPIRSPLLSRWRALLCFVLFLSLFMPG